MKRHIDVVQNPNSSFKEKKESITALTNFKTALLTFCNSELDTDEKTDINIDNIDAVINSIYSDVQELNVDCIEDIAKLYLLKHKIDKCESILKDFNPKVIMCEEEEIEINDKIKSKFTLASNLEEFIDWDSIDDNYENGTLSNVIFEGYRHKTNKVIFPKIPKIDKKPGDSKNSHYFNFKQGDLRILMTVDENDYLIYLFLTFKNSFIALYYENDIDLHIVSNTGTKIIKDDGFEIDVNSKFSEIYENIMNNFMN